MNQEFAGRYITDTISRDGLIRELTEEQSLMIAESAPPIGKMIRKGKREIDWSILIKKMIKEGYRMEDIAKASGFSTRIIRDIAKERSSNVEMNKTIELLLLFLRNTDKDIPIVGDYYDEKLG